MPAIKSLLLTLIVLAAMFHGAIPATADGDDYPSEWRDTPQDSAVDDWGHFNRECTSFVSWRLHSRNGYDMPFHDNHDGAYDGTYGTRTIETNSVSGYIHFKDLSRTTGSSSVLPDGQIVENI